MPLTLCGNGTVTGLAVGGLPDGSVDGDTIANTVTTGKVLQVVHNSYATQVSIQGGTAITGLNATITPTKANSKIFVIANQQGQIRVDSDPSQVINFYVDINVNSGGETEIEFQMYLGGNYPNNRRSNRLTTMTILDTPSYSVGNSIVYRVRAGTYTSNYGLRYTAQVNAASNPSRMTLMEIAA